MERQRYKILFCGEIVEGKSVGDVKEAMANLMQARVLQIEKLFSGRPVILKKDVSAAVAARYVAAFNDIGAIVEVRPLASTARAPDDSAAVPGDPQTPTVSREMPAGAANRSADSVWEPRSMRPTARPPFNEDYDMHSANANAMISGADRLPEEHYEPIDSSNDSGVLEVFGFLLKLIFSLIFTAVIVGTFVVYVLHWTGTLEFFGFSSPSDVLALLRAQLEPLMRR